MGRDFVPGYLLPVDTRVPVTMVFLACPLKENTCLNKNNKKITSSDSLSVRLDFCGTRVHGKVDLFFWKYSFHG